MSSMFPKLNMHERQVYRKYRVAVHDEVSFYNDHFDRWYGINSYKNGDQEFFGISFLDYMVSEKSQDVDKEAQYVGKAT